MSEALEKRIKAVAQELLSNTTEKPLRDELEFVFLNPWQDEDDIYFVVEKILNDGYDITGFGLVETPAWNVYHFYNSTTKQAFIVCYFDAVEEPYWGFAYLGEWQGDYNGFPADSIQEAVENYKFNE